MPENNTVVLTEATYLILLSLCSQRHGYSVMQFVSEMTNGRVNLGAGTLYGAINTLVEKKWILPLEGEKNSRKKEYIITDLGKQILKSDLERIEQLTVLGKQTLNEGV